MGISYHPVAKFGVRFQKSHQVHEFIISQHGEILNDDDDLREQVESFFSLLTLTPLNMFSTQEAILGYDMTLGETVEKYQALWEKDFPNSTLKPEPILAVRTW